MTQRLAPVPKSTATTAYGWFGDVAKLIREEPRRIYMSDWVKAYRKPDLVVQTDYDYEAERYRNSIPGPACGTVGCIAGWLHLSKVSDKRRVKEFPLQWVAAKLKAPFNAEWDDLDTADEFSEALHMLFHGGFPDAPYGTQEYADHVAANIEKFRQTWKSRLQRTKV